MTDYSKLVKALRCENTGDDECGSSDCPYWSGLGCMDGQLMEDAADAIEALQAEMPKRGKWVHNTAVYGTTTGGLTVEHHYTCSVCGGLMGRKGDKFCYNCGAKMEVQE